MKRRNTWHVLHLVMCFLTGFLWSIIWLACAVSNSRHNAAIDRIEQKRHNELIEQLIKRSN